MLILRKKSEIMIALHKGEIDAEHVFKSADRLCTALFFSGSTTAIAAAITGVFCIMNLPSQENAGLCYGLATMLLLEASAQINGKTIQIEEIRLSARKKAYHSHQSGIML